jgi:hypothetical protein
LGVGFGVALADAEEDEQPGADLAGDFARDGHASGGDALNYGSHSSLPVILNEVKNPTGCTHAVALMDSSPSLLMNLRCSRYATHVIPRRHADKRQPYRTQTSVHR